MRFEMTFKTIRRAGIATGCLLFTHAAVIAADGEGQLGAQWQQWALSIPAAVNPQLDATGSNCMLGQRGSVWFLAGTFGGGNATRACSVPEGSTLFFPVINYVNINAPNVCGQGPENVPVKDLRAGAKQYIDGATDLAVELDGRPVHFVRQRSTAFEVALPPGNVFEGPCGGPGTVPPGIYSAAVDDGYYAKIERLEPGPHVLHIHSANPGGGFVLDVVYYLTVTPVLGNGN
jgi:hypothetical protein